MTQSSINTFSDGMVTDLDNSLRSANSYSYAANLRYIANINSNTGTLHSVESSKLIANSLSSDEYIVGHRQIRDYLVVFTTRLITTGTHYRSDRILRFTISSTSLTSLSVIYTTTDLYTDTPDTFPEYLSVVGVYEDIDNIKVYWANSLMPTRSINITVSGQTIDKDRLNTIPLFSTNSLSVYDVVSGSLTTGKVQYSFSLYKDKGQESLITSPTNLISLYEDGISTPNSVNIKGDYESTDTGKGVQLYVSGLDSADVAYFDKLRLYRIYYSEYGQLPTITIVNDFEINGTSFYIFDSGDDGLGTYTSEEFSIISSIQYNAYTLEEKDGVLFQGNLKESYFNIDGFDTRAFRFKKNTHSISPQVCNLYENYDGVYISAEDTIDATTFSYATPSAWPTIVSENCINPYNDVDLDTDVSKSFDYLYQANGTTVGGEGPNIKYSFINTPIIELDNTINNALAYTYGTGVKTDYSNPNTIVDYTGYQRGEIYRLGIIFFNDKGQASPVGWIGDIRIPWGNELNSISVTTGGKTIATPVGLEFILKDYPEGTVSWEIVRVKREKKDRSIITSGYTSITVDVVYDPYPEMTIKHPWPISYTASTYDGAPGAGYTFEGSDNRFILNFVSPEECYQGYSDIRNGDYIHYVGILGDQRLSSVYPQFYTNPSVKQSIKYTSCISDVDFVSPSTRTRRRTIEEHVFATSEVSPVKEFSFTKAANGKYVAKVGTLLRNIGTRRINDQQHGRCSVIQIEGASSFGSSLSDYNIRYTYITRNNISRYGGYTIPAKNLNKYISCGSVLPISSSTQSIFGGDTYINYFDYLSTIYRQETDTSALGGIDEEDRISVSVIFPTESVINNSLRSDDHYASVEYTNEYIRFMKEFAGTYSLTIDQNQYYTQETDLYLYNSIYSQEQNIGYYYSAYGVDFDKNLDVRVAYSDKKIYDETIDSWTKFRALNYIDVESRHGAIKSLSKYNNNLYFFQDKAMGYLSVNQRSLLSDNNPGALSLGTGGTLDRFDYIDEYHGVNHKKSITSSSAGIFFYDVNSNKILGFNGETLSKLSDEHGLKTYLNKQTVQTIPFVTSNSKENEVYFNIGTNVLVYNTLGNIFISEYLFTPTYMGDTNKYNFYTLDAYDGIFGLYLGTTYGSFYGTTYSPAQLTVINNDSFYNTKVYDNMNFVTNSKSLTNGTDGNRYEFNTNNFDTVSFWNDYQYTGIHTLTLGSNLRKSERGYTLSIPRNIVKYSGITNIDIFSPTNHNSARTFKERLRDKYITANFTYTHSSTKGQLSVPYISFLYRESKR